jgi:PqqD family protein of HPr-rel-A system
LEKLLIVNVIFITCNFYNYGDIVQTAEQLIVLTSQAVSCELGGEAVILDIRSGQYFALSPVGAQIWKLLESPCTLASLCAKLAEEYDVEPARCEADVSALLGQLAGHGLIAFEECG